MSNQQWNTGQGADWPPQKPEGGASEQPTTQHNWGQQADWTQQGQTSASEWGQPQPAVGQEWQQAQPQPSAGDWHQAQPQTSAGDWHQAQPQQPTQDWTQQGWDQQQAHQAWEQQPQQAWDQQGQQWQGQAPQQGYYPAEAGYAGQWQGGPVPAPAPKSPSPFDFAFKRGSLPGAAGTIFLVGTIGIAVWWLFEFIYALVYIIDFPLEFFISLLGNAGLAVFGIMMLRAVLEVGVAAAGLLHKQDAPAEAVVEDTPQA